MLKSRDDCVGVQPVGLSPLWFPVKNDAQAQARTGCKRLASITGQLCWLAITFVSFFTQPRGHKKVKIARIKGGSSSLPQVCSVAPLCTWHCLVARPRAPCVHYFIESPSWMTAYPMFAAERHGWTEEDEPCTQGAHSGHEVSLSTMQNLRNCNKIH